MNMTSLHFSSDDVICFGIFLFLEPKSRVCTVISHCEKKLLHKRWKVFGSQSHVCPPSFLTAHVVSLPRRAVVARGFGHLHLARASSGATEGHVFEDRDLVQVLGHQVGMVPPVRYFLKF